MKLLVWQWGRRGAGPRYAVELARALGAAPGLTVRLSLSAGAEVLAGPSPPDCALPIATYAGLPGLAARLVASPLLLRRLVSWLRRERVDLAVCAMPAALDLVMASALRIARVPYAVVIHDADLHPGDRFAVQIRLQRWLLAGAACIVALSGHVVDRLREQGAVADRPVLRSVLPPFHYGAPAAAHHGGRLRLLSFGRLLPYKGLDLLADALQAVGPREDLEVRIVGSGPASEALDRLAALPGVTVENRWVPEAEMGALLGWADAVILSHREASQSGVVVAATAARRRIIATDVGGLAEQLAGEPGAILCPPTAEGLAHGIARATAERGVRLPPGDADARWVQEAAELAAGLAAVVRRR